MSQDFRIVFFYQNIAQILFCDHRRETRTVSLDFWRQVFIKNQTTDSGPIRSTVPLNDFEFFFLFFEDRNIWIENSPVMHKRSHIVIYPMPQALPTCWKRENRTQTNIYNLIFQWHFFNFEIFSLNYTYFWSTHWIHEEFKFEYLREKSKKLKSLYGVSLILPWRSCLMKKL